MITIGKTHVLSSKGISVDFRDNAATEAVKRLVKAALFVSETAHDDDRRSAIVALTAALAPFTETEEGR